MENIIENNKLIAEFMGIDFMNNNIFINRLPKDFLTYSDNYRCFHNAWDWLMPVVEKIETISEFDKLPEFFIMYDNREEFKGWYWSIEIPKKFNKECYKHNNREKTKIEAYYNSCIEFIKWYNNHLCSNCGRFDDVVGTHSITICEECALNNTVL